MKNDIIGKVDEHTAMFKATITDPEKMGEVMSERMAEIGRSMSCLYFFNKCAPLRPSLSSIETYDIGTDKRTASSIEQRNEIPKAVNRNRSNRLLFIDFDGFLKSSVVDVGT